MARTTLRRKPKRTIRQWLRDAIGEISVLRTLGGWFGSFNPGYMLDSSRVDYNLARELYNNTNDDYKLGAGFARPIINTTAGFMGVPHFSHMGANEEADQELERAFSRWSGKLLRIHRNALRDGDVFARLTATADQFDPKRSVIDLMLIPPEWVTPIPDPVNGGYLEVIIRTPVEIKDEDGRLKHKYYVVERITKDTQSVKIEGDAPDNVRQALEKPDEKNNWGFVPIVHFKNEAEEHQLFGASDLEPVEPFMKAYHDVMLFAIQGAKLFSHPKVKIHVKDIQQFLDDNFETEEIERGVIKFDSRDIFFVHENENIEFITADPGLDGVTTLLQFLFYCIVDVSETPEFAFGTAVQSSKASVSEQMVPLARKIRRKRGMFEEAHQELAAMYLAMWAKVNNVKLDTYQVDVGWEEISPKNDKEIAETITTLINGLTTGIESGIISVDSAAEFLREFVPSMLPWVDEDADDDERRRVARSLAMMQRLRDGMGLPAIEGEATENEGDE